MRSRTLIRDMVLDLIESRDLAWRLAVRDVSAQYRASVLGFFWAFVPALLSASLFIFLRQKSIVNIPDTGMPYPLFVLVGTMLWQTFAEAVHAPLRVATGAKPILSRINFPREALILSAFYQTAFGFFIKAVLLVGVLVYFGAGFRWQSILCLVPIFLLIWLGTAIGMLLTPLGLLLMDVSQMVIAGLQLAFFLTPVIYPAPQDFPYSLLVTLNPVSSYLLASRELLVLGTISSSLFTPMMIVSAVLVLGTAAAWILYRVFMPIIVERISA